MITKDKIVQSIRVYHRWIDGEHTRYLWYCPVVVPWYHSHGLQVGGPYTDSVNIDVVIDSTSSYLFHSFQVLNGEKEEYEGT